MEANEPSFDEVAEWAKEVVWYWEGSDRSPNLPQCAAEVAASHGHPALADALLSAVRAFMDDDEGEG